jgi:hypothetical protein
MASDMPPPPPPEDPPPYPADAIPWETPGTPVLAGFIETIKAFISSPRRAYERMPINSDFLRPLIYLIVIGWICAWVAFAWSTLFEGTMRSLIPGGFDTGETQGWQAFMASTAFSVGSLVLYPVVASIFAFLVSGVIHLLLMLVGGASSGYFATFRVYCYAAGTTSVASLIPICGSFLDFIWMVVLCIIGIAVAHRTTQARAALAVLIPVVGVCLCCVLFAVIAGIAAAGPLR